MSMVKGWMSVNFYGYGVIEESNERVEFWNAKGKDAVWSENE
jgi:hypothetical protein